MFTGSSSSRRVARLSESSREESPAYSQSVRPLCSQTSLPSSVELEACHRKEIFHCEQMDALTSIAQDVEPLNEHLCMGDAMTSSSISFASSAQMSSQILLCEFCDATFASSSGLRRHTKSIHLNKYPYACEVCGKGFLLKQRYTNHRKLHDGKTHNV